MYIRDAPSGCAKATAAALLTNCANVDAILEISELWLTRATYQ